MSNLLRQLPSVDQVLQTNVLQSAIAVHGRSAAVAATRAELDQVREAVRTGAPEIPGLEYLAIAVQYRLARGAQSRLRPVFNLTGTVLHTNLGRALLAEEAVDAAAAAMRQAIALEYDLESGGRGKRDDHLRDLICELTGAEDATVVNNNAAAVLLVLNTLSDGRDAIVSRGELIEIGGSFRMPEIMSRAGAHLVEVGTTNRTHAKDYLAAIGPQTGLIMKVHTSNYRIEGFTKEVSPRELAGLASDQGVPLFHDLGAGTLIDLAAHRLTHEPTVREAVRDGADIVSFSGDKLLGGPQAGFVVGKRNLIAAMNKNPMKRALRLDKIRLAALEATLRLYRDPDRLGERLPTLRLLRRQPGEMEAQAQRLIPLLLAHLGGAFDGDCVACQSQIGSGALPLETIPSVGISLRPRDGAEHTVAALAKVLRGLAVPIIGRIAGGALILDLRCLEDEERFLASWQAIRWNTLIPSAGGNPG